MPKLSLIESGAQQYAARVPASRRDALARSLVDRCETHWRELRGPEPSTPLAHALWTAAPPLAELFVDLHASGDARLADILGGIPPARALALLVLAEIERGEAEGVHIAYEAMMALDTPDAARVYGERVAAALRDTLPPPRHKHVREPLWRALVALVTHTGRHDIRALIAAIRLLTAPGDADADESLGRLRAALDETGVGFRAIEDGAIHYELRGHAHKPITVKHLSDLLAEVRQARLA